MIKFQSVSYFFVRFCSWSEIFWGQRLDCVAARIQTVSRAFPDSELGRFRALCRCVVAVLHFNLMATLKITYTNTGGISGYVLQMRWPNELTELRCFPSSKVLNMILSYSLKFARGSTSKSPTNQRKHYKIFLFPRFEFLKTISAPLCTRSFSFLAVDAIIGNQVFQNAWMMPYPL